MKKEHNRSKEQKIIGLFKFGQREYLEQLREGKLFLNTLSYFANLENSDSRRDEWEGVDLVFPGDRASLMADGDTVLPVGTITGHIRYTAKRTPKLHVFCMCAARESKANQLFDVPKLGFGDAWILFNDGDEFARRVKVAAEVAGLNFESGLVEYIKEDGFSGNIGPLLKRERYQSESEARIIVGPGGEGPLVLDVGDLRDLIGTVHDIKDLSKRIRINRPPSN